jgi:hypothetical protein
MSSDKDSGNNDMRMVGTPATLEKRLLAGTTWDGISFLARFTIMLRRLDFSKASVLFISPAKVFAVNLQLECLFLETAA